MFLMFSFCGYYAAHSMLLLKISLLWSLDLHTDQMQWWQVLVGFTKLSFEVVVTVEKEKVLVL